MAQINFQDFQCVWECWEKHAKVRPQAEAILHWDALEEPFRWTYQHLLEESLFFADHLLKHGVKPGQVCALILRHSKYFYPLYMGVTAIGAIPAVLAYPNERLHPDKFVHGLSGMAKHSGLDWVLTENDLEEILKPLILHQQSSIKDIFFPLDWKSSAQALTPNHPSIQQSRKNVEGSNPFLLQHSSGTTGLQKAVTLSHRAVLNHVERYAEAIQLNANDKVISWLPLYHDMGLIAAFHMPLAFGIPSIQIDAFQWLSSPAMFFQILAKEKATLAWLPNFAYNFMSDRISEEDAENIDFSSLRMLINCSEVVRPDSHIKFFQRFGKYGLKKESLAASYAMAETTFAITQTTPGQETSCVRADRSSLAKGIVEPPQNQNSEKLCASSGKTIRGCWIKILDDNNGILPEDRVGTIAIKSESMFQGYRNQPDKTKQVLQDNWYISGDHGFLHAGECYVLGRKDDVIINAGKNIFPEDIENVVNQVQGVIPGRVVAFGIEDPKTGTQTVCVLAETEIMEEKKRADLILAIKQAGMGIDVTLAQVYLVPLRSLIKSSSGKISRKMNRERLVSGSITSGESL